MIRELYRKYRKQIFLAFLLVIIENVTFIAEPYIFGKAIDDLREANLIEEEVDSTLANTVVRHAIDSVREHLIDSLLERDTLERLDTAITSELQAPQRQYQGWHIATTSLGQTDPQPFHDERRVRRKERRDSMRSHFDKRINEIARTHSDSERTQKLRHTQLPAHVQRKLRDVFNERDSLQMAFKKSNSSHAVNKKTTRDSLRSEIKKRPREKQTIAKEFSREKPPVSFFFPKDLGPFIPALLPWVILYLISSLVGALRRYYDTKTYTKMFARLASDVVEKQLAAGEDISKIAGRSTLAWNNIEFFQYSLPEFIEQCINVGGAVIALSLFDWRLAAVGGGLILLVLIASRVYMSKIERYKTQINDLKEQEYDTFATRNPSLIRTFYTSISHLETRVSKLDTLGYIALRAGLLVMFLGTLYISLDLDRFTIGEIYSIVAYVWTFVTASEYIPYLSDKWVNLRDISKRLKTETIE